MAVYRRSFEPWAERLTSPRRRFLVPARYALSDLFRSKLFVVFVTLCFVYPIGSLFAVYLRHNTELLASLAAGGIEIEEWMPIDAGFFGLFMRVQGTLAFVLVLVAGPRLVSRDLTNNALALYLCRPFSRAQYVLGKLTVLAALCSLVTWVPGLALWLLQAGLEGGGWGISNLRSAAALLVGSWVWIAVLGLLALALSAWVRRRAVSSFLLLLAYVGGSFFAELIEQLFGTDWGSLLDLEHVVRQVWAQLFGTTAPFFLRSPELPAWPAWAVLAALTGASLLLLRRRLRAYEVVR